MPSARVCYIVQANSPTEDGWVQIFGYSESRAQAREAIHLFTLLMVLVWDYLDIVVTNIIRIAVIIIIIMCLVHDFPALDLTSTQRGDIDDWDFSSLAHLLLYNSVRVDGTLVFRRKPSHHNRDALLLRLWIIFNWSEDDSLQHSFRAWCAYFSCPGWRPVGMAI